MKIRGKSGKKEARVQKGTGVSPRLHWCLLARLTPVTTVAPHLQG
jgi:hypothetical protein